VVVKVSRDAYTAPPLTVSWIRNRMGPVPKSYRLYERPIAADLVQEASIGLAKLSLRIIERVRSRPVMSSARCGNGPFSTSDPTGSRIALVSRQFEPTFPPTLFHLSGYLSTIELGCGLR